MLLIESIYTKLLTHPEFHEVYGAYPKYPVADAGYGSFNNYIYCEQHGMEKYMKFPMYKERNERQEIPYQSVSANKL